MEKSLPWFCLRSQPKHEHIAAQQLASELGIEVYLPRIRFPRSTRRGRMWFTEALFPNYLFARFDLAVALRKVNSTRGVRHVVHFGDHWPFIPENAIEELRNIVRDDQIHVINDDMRAGDTVQITGGAFHGLQALVTSPMPGRERVEVLLEFLGRQTPMKISRNLLVANHDVRQWMHFSENLPARAEE